jgi:nucleotide-binding universal stress UspA family protein
MLTPYAAAASRQPSVRLIMKTFNHIVVPTDFSATARDALRMACAIARGTPAKISLVHVVADVWRQPWVAEAGIEIAGLQREMDDDAHKRLEALAAEEEFRGVPVQPVVLIGAPPVEVANYVDTQGADLMVVGTHGHGPVRRFLLGSVAERLIRMARCPVLAVPHESLRGKPAAAHEASMASAAAGGASATERAVDEQC